MYVPAWVVVLVALLVVWLLVKQQRPPRFSPYRVTIQPQWRALLDDHLDMTPERWQAAEQWIAGHPGDASRLWRDGLTFTVLRAGVDGSLTYLDHQHAFQSALDWSEAVPGLCWPSEIAARFGEEGIQPRLIVREGADDYELTIEVSDLPMIHPSRRASAEDDAEHGRRLVIARLPRALFTSPTGARPLAALTAAGWSQPEHAADDVAPSLTMAHKYVRVAYAYI